MTKEEFSELLNKGNYTQEFRKFLENATIAWEESKHPELRGKIKVKWIGDTKLQPYCEEYQFGTEEGFRNGGIAFKIKSCGDPEKDCEIMEEFINRWSPRHNYKFSDIKEGGKITFRLPEYPK